MLFFLDICFCVPKRQTHQCVFQTNGNASNTLAMKHLENILPYLWMRFPGPCKCIHVYASPQSINLWPCDGALRSDRAILIVRSCVCVRGRLSIWEMDHNQAILVICVWLEICLDVLRWLRRPSPQLLNRPVGKHRWDAIWELLSENVIGMWQL